MGVPEVLEVEQLEEVDGGGAERLGAAGVDDEEHAAGRPALHVRVPQRRQTTANLNNDLYQL